MEALTDIELNEIGSDLEKEGYLAAEALALPASGMSDRVRHIVVAVTFFERWWPILHPRCCEGQKIREEFQDAMDTGAAITDALLTMKGLPLPAASLAKILVKSGIGRLCLIVPKAD